MKEHKDIKEFLREKAKRKKKISITVNEKHLEKLKILSEIHKVPLSSIIEACLYIGLTNPSINPESLLKKNIQGGKLK